MHGTNKEIQEWLTYGKRALRRVVTTAKPTPNPKKLKIIRRRVTIEGHIHEFDQVIEY